MFQGRFANKKKINFPFFYNPNLILRNKIRVRNLMVILRKIIFFLIKLMGNLNSSVDYKLFHLIVPHKIYFNLVSVFFLRCLVSKKQLDFHHSNFNLNFSRYSDFQVNSAFNQKNFVKFLASFGLNQLFMINLLDFF